MEAVIPVITTPNLLLRHRLGQSCFLAAPRPSFAKWVRIQSNGFSKQRSCRCLAIDEKRIMEDFPENNNDEKEIADEILKMAGTSGSSLSSVAVEEKLARKKSERFTYLAAAIMSSLGFISMSAFAVYYRFSWQMQGGEAVPLEEMVGTFALAVGAAVGMEYWARWAHRALWHASLWNMHESHHKPRKGPFELNDVFAIINAVPAMGLLGYGTLNKGLFPGLCFGALSFSTHDVAVSVAITTGLGITMFGMAYMFVHDGLVHRRFAVGPIADVPYLRRVAAAHQLHHSDIFDGVPYGLFLGPMELEEAGGIKELDKEVQRRIKLVEENSS